MILQDFDTFNVKVPQIINYNGPPNLGHYGSSV